MRGAIAQSAVRAAWADAGTQRVLKLMAPALLGVSVAQVSLLINTQIASHLRTGSVSWLSYADRLMEFPTAMLGVALGVVLLPQLASAQAAGDADRYSQLLDWGLRLVVLLAVPCAVALLTFAQPLVAVLYHYGAFSEREPARYDALMQELLGWLREGRIGGVIIIFFGLHFMGVLPDEAFAAAMTRQSGEAREPSRDPQRSASRGDHQR